MRKEVEKIVQVEVEKIVEVEREIVKGGQLIYGDAGLSLTIWIPP